MSLYSFNYGLVNNFSKVLTDTTTTTLLSVTASDPELTVIVLRAGLASGASDTTVRFDLYDGTTAFPIVNWITTQADEVYKETDPIHIEAGWSLRATRSAGSNVYITGVYIEATRA